MKFAFVSTIALFGTAIAAPASPRAATPSHLKSERQVTTQAVDPCIALCLTDPVGCVFSGECEDLNIDPNSSVVTTSVGGVNIKRQEQDDDCELTDFLCLLSGKKARRSAPVRRQVECNAIEDTILRGACIASLTLVEA
ncbi:hypothetical protein QC761_609940 [Podospora bellae-mahoneyi]|uniref:Extracellular membrane protein CFEM domain-containing protein n=1 Tax=Podospora bellae-mahoneyi TaxID=2093777 RepID=A0ABR0FDR0_9PEZI|nr:hypothetical protein QC761_609940 [Podospora bellae-mahoneyi]